MDVSALIHLILATLITNRRQGVRQEALELQKLGDKEHEADEYNGRRQEHS